MGCFENGTQDYFTRGTTPDWCFELDRDISDWDVYVTFEQWGKALFTVHPAQASSTEAGCMVTGRLTQAQTLMFTEGSAQAQVRAYKDGAAGAGDEFAFKVRGVLLDGEIPQEVDQ